MILHSIHQRSPESLQSSQNLPPFPLLFLLCKTSNSRKFKKTESGKTTQGGGSAAQNTTQRGGSSSGGNAGGKEGGNAGGFKEQKDGHPKYPCCHT